MFLIQRQLNSKSTGDTLNNVNNVFCQTLMPQRQPLHLYTGDQYMIHEMLQSLVKRRIALQTWQ